MKLHKRCWHFLCYLVCAWYRCKNKSLIGICVYSDMEHKAVITHFCSPYRCKNKSLRDICFYSDMEHKAFIARFVLRIAVKTIFLNLVLQHIFKIIWLKWAEWDLDYNPILYLLVNDLPFKNSYFLWILFILHGKYLEKIRANIKSLS